MNQMLKCKIDEEKKAKHRTIQCPPKYYRTCTEQTKPEESRPALFRRIMQEVKKKVKSENGHGQYSWRIGMKRRNARRIMLRITRRTMKTLREKTA